MSRGIARAETTNNNTKMTTELDISLRRAARKAVLGTVVHYGRGRTDYPRRVNWSTPVVAIPGDSAPQVKGAGYWKTGFSNGTFRKVLYTPSTLRVEVGENWRPQP